MTKPLWEMAEDFRQTIGLLETIIENSEMDPAIKATAIDNVMADIDASAGTIDAKLGNCRAYKLSTESEIDAIDREIARLRQAKQHRENALARINDYVKSVLELMDGKYKTDLFTVRLQKSADTVEIVDQSKLPSLRKMPEIWRTKDPEPDKLAIRKAIKDGKQIDGAVIVPGKKHVRW